MDVYRSVMADGRAIIFDGDVLKKRLLFLFLLSLAYLFPLLVAGKYYNDDLLHSFAGKTPWASNGRPLSDLLLHVLMPGRLLNDISPIPQILGAAVLSAMAALLSFRIAERGVFLPATVFFPLICSPFFLENWSFKYDALPMSVAVATAVAPFALKNAGGKRQFAASAIFVFISLCFYQAAANLFVAFTAIFFLIEVNRGDERQSLYSLFARASGYTVACLTYYAVAKSFFVTGDYNIQNSSVIYGGFWQIFEIVKHNLRVFHSYFWSAFSKTLQWYFLPSVLLSVAFLARLLTVKKYSIQGIVWGTFLKALFIAAAATIYLASFGPLLLLQTPVFSPRVLLGATGVPVFLLLCTYLFLEKCKKLAWIIFVPVFGMFVLAYSYYNAARTTEAIEATMIAEIKASVAVLKERENIRGIAFHGGAPHSRQAALAMRNFPLIANIPLNNLNQDYLWGELKLASYGLQVPYITIGNRQFDFRSMRVVADGGFYLLKLHDGILFVDYVNREDHAR